MAFATLRREERIGLVLAIALHGALLVALALRAASPPVVLPQPISVTLSNEVGLTPAAPTHADAAAAEAPRPGTVRPTAPVPVAPPAPAPQTIEKPLPVPAQVAMTKPRLAMTAAKPPAAPAARPTRKHAATVEDWSLADPNSSPEPRPAGASRIGADFLKGVTDGKASGKAATQGAAATGPVRAALSAEITRQLKPHWVAPEGVDADRLVTLLDWDLNPDGSLAGSPQVVRQLGIDDSNRPQAARHAEQAIRAVRLAAPFSLPPRYYGTWQHVRSFAFNRALSQ